MKLVRGRGLEIALSFFGFSNRKASRTYTPKLAVTSRAHFADGKQGRGNSKHRVYAGLTKEFTKEAGVDSKYTMCAEGA